MTIRRTGMWWRRSRNLPGLEVDGWMRGSSSSAAVLVLFTFLTACTTLRQAPDGEVAQMAPAESEVMQVDAPGFAAMSFDSSRYHFGEVKRGQVVERELSFVNTGTAPLDIARRSTTRDGQSPPENHLRCGSGMTVRIRRAPSLSTLRFMPTCPMASNSPFFTFSCTLSAARRSIHS